MHQRAVQHSEGELQWDSGCTGPNIHTVCIWRVLFLAGHSLVLWPELGCRWSMPAVHLHSTSWDRPSKTMAALLPGWTKAQWMGATKASPQKRSLDHQETLTSDTSWVAWWGSWRSSLYTPACAQSHVLKPTGLEGLYHQNTATEMLSALQIHFRVSVHHNCTLLWSSLSSLWLCPVIHTSF